ncbi:MAG: hypothetical protein CSA81_01035 [Acidobacteria bacterium]|nr:MAG: hypothetical protein CSA81_01035 [Acidobacteriota bacterium]
MKVLFIGLGEYERALLRRISEDWKVIIMDTNEAQINEYQRKYPDIETIKGDASSIITLKKVDFSRVAHIICSIRDTDVVKEICHILRVALQVDAPIIIMHYTHIDTAKLEGKDITFFNPIELGSRSVLNRMGKNLIRPTSLGKGTGEIIEVVIKSASHLTSRRLKYMRPTNWHVSMIYRHDEPLVPTGELKLQIGDRVILAGKPKILENIAQLLITGTPQFPQQYGTHLYYPLEEQKEHLHDEAAFWLNETKVKQIQYIPYHKHFSKKELADLKKGNVEYGKGIRLFKDIFDRKDDQGMVFVELNTLFKKARIKSCFKYAKAPVLVSRSSYPYKRILVSLNCHQSAIALETGVEIARLTGIPLEACFVTMPEEMQHDKEKELLDTRSSLVKDFKSIFKMNLTYHLLKGNPVRKTLALIEKEPDTLLLVVSDPVSKLSLLNTNVPFLTTVRTQTSTLIIPGDQTHV